MDDSIHDIVIQELCSLLRLQKHNLDYDASFPAHGGNSLSAVKLAKICKKRGCQLDVGTIIRSPSLSELVRSTRACPKDHHCLSDTHIALEASEESKAWPGDWLDHIEATGVDFRIDLQQFWSSSSDLISEHSDANSNYGAKSSNTDPSIHGSLDPGPYDVLFSEMQLALIHGSVKSPGTNIIRYLEIYSPEHIPLIKNAWRTLFEQESILGVRYSADLLPQRIRCFDWSEVITEDEAQFNEWVSADTAPAYIGSCWQVVSLAMSGQPDRLIKSVVIWTIHHALIDGYSAQLLVGKLRQAAAGVSTSAGPSPFEMTSKIQMLRSARRNEGDAFWARQKDLLDNAASSLQYPPPIEAQVGPNKEEFGELEIQTGFSDEDLDAIARDCGITTATIYYAAWVVLLATLADSDKVVLGVALSGHNVPVPGIEEAIGAFVNTVPLAVSVSSASTLSELATAVFEHIHLLSEYQWTTPDNGYTRNFQTALYMQYDLDAGDESSPVQPVVEPHFRQTSQTPLSVLIFPTKGRICLQYKTSDFQRSQIQQLGEIYQYAIMAFTRLDTSLRTVQASLMRPQDYQSLQEYGNCLSDQTSPSSVTDDLVTLFERSVDRHPNDMAIEKGDQSLTYAEADRKAGLVALTLVNHGVKPGDIVCVDADRSIHWIVSIFGVLKAGAVYCALDWELPGHLRSLMFSKTAASVFLAGDDSAAARRPDSAAVTVTVESLFAVPEAETPSTNEQTSPTYPRRQCPVPSATAYVCFTSGSTGTPKGVMCSHEGLVAFQRDLEVRLFAQPGVSISQVMSPAFDGSIHEIFSALCHGATLILPAGDNVFQALDRANSAILTPSVAAVLDPEDYPLMKQVYLVGEPVTKAVNDKWGSSKILYNMYGPTEGTGGATIKRLRPHEPITIGAPNPSTRIYITGGRGQLVLPGMIGEICIAGVQVARGYLGLPELTAERFVDSFQFGPASSESMYRTGDRGYWLPCGEIVCLGRNDRQIKLRGFRLDLNDLEIRIAQAVPGLKAVAMAPREDFLVAAFQPESLDHAAVAACLARVLPAYAQPQHLIFVDKFPRTKAGKLDYSQLVSDTFIKVYTEPGELQTPLEAKIAAVWRQLLKLPPSTHVGPQSNFLRLGGSSLLQITLLAKLSSKLKVKIPLKVVIQSESLEHLASQLERLLTDPQRPSLGGNAAFEAGKLSPIEQDWWMKYQLVGSTSTSAFNVSFVASLDPSVVDAPALANAWDTVLARHMIFRGRYEISSVRVERRALGRRYADHPPCVHRVRHVDAWAEVNRPFDPAHESACRVTMSTTTLAVVLSHAVADLTTLQILLREVKILAEGGSLPPVTHAYEDSIALWDDEPSLCDHKFWSEYLDGYDVCPAVQVTLPSQAGFASTPNPTPRRNGYCGTSRIYQLSDTLAASIQAFPLRHDDMSLQQLAIASVGLALQGSRGDETDIVLGTPFINRLNDRDMETVGLFLEPLPVRVRHTRTEQCNEGAGQQAGAGCFLDAVRRSANAAIGHAIPWHRLLEHLDVTPRYPDHPLFDVMVTFHTSANGVSLDIDGVEQRLTWAEGAKFSVMTEFTAFGDGTVILRVEYDHLQHSAQSIDGLVQAISTSMSMLLLDSPCHVIKQELLAQSTALDKAVFKQGMFGKQVSDIHA